MLLEAAVERLQEWSQPHNLIEEALQSCQVALKNNEQDDKEVGLVSRWELSDIQLRFDKQSLVFKDDILS